MSNLWSENHPRNFWQCQQDFSANIWEDIIAKSFPLLELNTNQRDVDTILALTLGEARFGADHWTFSLPKRVYYLLKPIIPRGITRPLRRIYHHAAKKDINTQWLIEPRYVNFLWNIMANLLLLVPGQEIFIKSLWRQNYRYALALTHDIETHIGQGFIRAVADLEEGLGFRSSFNFVPKDYRIDMNLVDELQRRGFEVGIHGLKHDGKLFNSRPKFERSALEINQYLKHIGAVGFRSPLTQRNPEWMQSLEIEYDLSFFDSDPFEPIPGGTMSIWPFRLGHFIELPYTLVQDYTLTDVLKEGTPRLWFKKVEFIRQHCGMALLNSHPDYLKDKFRFKIYAEFLQTMQQQGGYWHALPCEIAQWWRQRANSEFLSKVSLDNGAIYITPQSNSPAPMTHLISTLPS